MATILDVSLLQYFNAIYAVLFVFAILFAILQKTKAVSDKPTINSILAIAISLMILVSDNLVKIISFMVPWFAIVIIFVILLLLIFRLFGAEDQTFKSLMDQSVIKWGIIIVGILIFGVAMSNVFGQKVLPATLGGDVNTTFSETGSSATGSFEQNIYAILFNPKVLGVIILFAVAVFAIILLSSG